MTEVHLAGCTPEPLMSYLKALGVFRLVAEQADPAAKLSWHAGHAVLHSQLDRTALTAFFREQYAPTPILAPWGARSGFYAGTSEKAAREALDRILAADSLPRLEAMRAGIMAIRQMLKARGFDDKVKDEDKLDLMRICRNELPDNILNWLDAVYIVTEDGRKLPPLLGTGGNEGSGSYVSNFSQAVVSLLVDRSGDTLIDNSLFEDFQSLGRRTEEVSTGHFSTTALDGANSSQGFSGGGIVNNWDFLLAMEGCLLFAGAAARRIGTDSESKAAFPFCVEPVAVGYGSHSDREVAKATRAELWVPLWSRAMGLEELRLFFSEGRAQFGRRQARNAVEFAVAISCLGIDRGIDTFVRYAFMERFGQNYYAAPLGRFAVTPRPAADLLTDPTLTDWLDRLRRACRDKEKTPARYQSALRGIDSAMFGFANRSSHDTNDPKALVTIIEALGAAERILATEGLSWLKDKQYGWKLQPLNGLNAQWLERANDNTPEFRLAASLAGVRGDEKIPPLREYLEKVVITKFVSWEPESRRAVWSRQSLAENLAAVFRRRQMEAFQAGLEGVPLSSPRPARLDDVLAFLRGETDDDKLSDLVWGLLGIEMTPIWPDDSHEAIPFELGVPRLLVESTLITRDGSFWQTAEARPANAVHDPEVFHALAVGRASDALTKAARRLKSGGLLVNGYRNRHRAGERFELPTNIDTTRLLASMLFPLAERDLDRIASAVLYPPESEI